MGAAGRRSVHGGFSFGDDGVSAFYEWISGGWIWLELAAILGTIVLYLVFRAPLLGLTLTLFALNLAEDGTARAIGFDCYSNESTLGAMVPASGCLLVAAATGLDYAGLRRHDFWPHTLGATGVVTGLDFLLADDSYQLALIVSVALRPGASGLALVGTAAWLSLAGSPLRRRLHTRALPAPQRD